MQGPGYRTNLSPTHTIASRVLNQYPGFASTVPEIARFSVPTWNTATSTEASGYPSTEHPEYPTEPPWLSERTATIVFQITFLIFQHTAGLKGKTTAAKDKIIEVLDDEQIRTQIALCVLLLDAADKTVTQVPPEMNLFMFLYGFQQYLRDHLDSDQ